MKQDEFVEQVKALYPTTRLCRVRGVSPSGSWAGKKRVSCARATANAPVQERSVAAHTASRATSGAPRMQAEVRAQGVCRSRKRVARLLRLSGVAGCHRRRVVTTRRDPARQSAPDLVGRACAAAAPNQVGAAASTYVPTGPGVLFVAVVLDTCRRRMVGWSMAAHLRAELVVAALERALQHRRPAVGVMHHSDHGSQDTALTFQERCRAAGIRSSMGSVGDCSDNAMAESCCATRECELRMRSSFRTHAEARAALFDYIEVFSNRRRRHSALGYLSPDTFENRRLRETPVAA